jgi:two-component system, NtrC family, nitrogen regulation response regulator GlnG
MTTAAKPTVLVVDDEPSICWGFERLLGEEGYRVLVAGSAEEGLQLAGEHAVSLVLLDVRLPGESGLSALPKFRTATADAPIVVMTAFGDLETAVTAVKQGASDYLTKPFRLADAADVCQRAMRRASNQQPSVVLSFPGAIPRRQRTHSLIGASPAMQKVFRQIALVAASDLSVLITGETGTGKELVAAAIHRHSHRSDAPYLAVAPVAFNPSLLESELFGHVRGAFTGANEDRKGLFETASGGTILLDEIGDLPLAAQVKLLRVIEQRQYTRVGEVQPRSCDVRILAATHRDLRRAVGEGTFREDLLYRLSAVTIELPPLRSRSEDIAVLANHFLAELEYPSAQSALSQSLVEQLQARPWYGNVRELRNAVEHAAVIARGRPLDINDFPPPQESNVAQAASTDAVIEAWARSELDQPGDSAQPLYERFLQATEPALLRTVLQQTGGNRAAAADRLGMHRATLRERMKRYGLE